MERDRVMISPPTTAAAPSISPVMRNAWRWKGMKAGRAELKKLLPTWCGWGFVAYPKEMAESRSLQPVGQQR